MADIKQAAKWMAEGQMVRRESPLPLTADGKVTKAWAIAFDENNLLVEAQTGYPVWISASSLLADDWEIADGAA